MNFDWNDLAFGSKKDINALNAYFIAAPRDMSAARLTQLAKTYLPHGNIIIGVAKEPYVTGFEGQPQFKTLPFTAAEKLAKKVNAAGFAHKIYTLSYFQRDTTFILQKLTFKKIVFINGSWKHMFHTLPMYYVLATKHIDYQLESPFANEVEAREYESKALPPEVPPAGIFTAVQMLDLASLIAQRSFDNGFQTGVTLGRQKGEKYKFIAQGFNKVVPYQAYAMHHGASRETNFSPMHDLNYYDTVHAEVDFMVRAQKQKIDLAGTTLFINLLPCPSCARMFTQTDIAEIVYREDHSEGYGVKLLELAGKKVTRIVR